MFIAIQKITCSSQGKPFFGSTKKIRIVQHKKYVTPHPLDIFWVHLGRSGASRKVRELKNAVLKLLKICNQVENFESQFLLNGPTNSFNSNGFELVLIYISGNSIKPEHLFLSGAKVLWRHRARDQMRKS